MFDPHLLRRFGRRRHGTGIGLDESERLLAGAMTDRTPLAAMLRAAAAPAQPEELSGERAAVDAFTAAYRPAPSSPSRRTRRTALATLVAVSASLVAGTAFAAGTGHLPDPLQRGAHSLFAGVGVPAPAPPVASHPSSSPWPGPTGPRPAATDSPRPEELLALCRTWIAVQDDPHAGPVTAAQRHQLAAAAGGEPDITGYCRQLLEPTPAPTAHSTTTKPGNPSPGRKPSHPVKPSHP